MLRDGDLVTASDDTPRDLGPSADTFRDDLRAATSLLEQVIARYPRSDEAELAAEQLKTLR